MYGIHGGVADLDRISRLKADLQIQDTGVGDKVYIKRQLSKAWQELTKVQKGSVAKRDSHMDTLVQHYTNERHITKAIEISKYSE